MDNFFTKRWQADGGYREFLVLAIPLILSTASWSIQLFVDRVFLSWHSTAALAAAMPAGMTNFIFVSFFLGIAQYINTFVAQYEGAARFQRIGPSVWQGVYLALISGIFGWVLSSQATPLFDLIGHDPGIRAYEATYFSILCLGIPPIVLSTALSCFYSGRGKTWTVFMVNGVSMSINIILDYALIFGKWGFPEWGIGGAAWATNFASCFSAAFYFILLSNPRYRERYRTLKGWKPDRELLARLARYGGPNGLTFMLDILAFSLFILIVGRLGVVELAATNMAFNINSLAFMPLIGGGIAITTMVGQRLGANRPERAEYATWSGLHLALLYMGSMAAAYILVPELFLSPYGLNAEGAAFQKASAMAVKLLRYVAVYCMFDALYMVFTAALKGAGDTRYILKVSVALGWTVMVIPSFLWLKFINKNIFVIWTFVCAFIMLMGLVFYLRFRAGHWKEMRVIEEVPAPPFECAANRQEGNLFPGYMEQQAIMEKPSEPD